MTRAAVTLAAVAAILVWAWTGRARPRWVVFEPAAAATDAPAALSPEAVHQRRTLGIAPFFNDRPLPDSLVRLVEREGDVRVVSRWLRAISADLDRGAVRRLARHPAVRAIRPVASLEVASAGRMARFQQSTDSQFYGPNFPAIRDLGIPSAHVLGFTGRGIRIAILDTGFEPGHEALSTRTVVAARDFIEGDDIVSDPPGAGLTQSRHGTQVWSILGGYRPGTIVGPAYEAQFLLAKVDAQPGDTRADEDRWVAALEWADSMGARVINSSVSFRYDFTDRPPIPYDSLNGDLTVTTRMADEAARRGIVVVVAMGNAGPAPGTLSAPADGDSVIAVGAVDAVGGPATFAQGATARGPTVDLRTKPEVAARGVGLLGASTPGTAAYETGLAGTSYATPLIAGAAAAFLQAWPELSALAVRRALVRSARRGANTDPNAVGAGVPDLASAILFPEGLSTTGVATVDLDGNLTTIAPTFSWSAPLVQANARPVVYRVELATDPVFNTIILSDTVREAFSLRTRVPLRPAQALWWRVTATANTGVRRTSAVAGPIAMPNWVRQISPAPSQVTFVDSAQPTLRWAPLEAPAPVGPFTYDVAVLTAENGELAQPVIRGITTSSVRLPQPLVANVAYRWRVIAKTPAGAADTVESASPFVVTSETRPPATLLYQNFPNPFPSGGGRTTRIWFDLADGSTVDLAIFDLRGRLVRRLIPAEASCGAVTLEPGQYGRETTGRPPDPCVVTTWDGSDANGVRVPRGVYVLRLRAGGREEFRRIVFLGDP